MNKMIEIRGVKYSTAVDWTEKSFEKAWKANKKLKANMQIAKNRDKAMKEDWEKLKQFLPKKPKTEPAYKKAEETKIQGD